VPKGTTKGDQCISIGISASAAVSLWWINSSLWEKHGKPWENGDLYGKSPFLMGKSTINDHFQW